MVTSRRKKGLCQLSGRARKVKQLLAPFHSTGCQLLWSVGKISCGDALLMMPFLHNSSGIFVPQPPTTEGNANGPSAVGKGDTKAEEGLFQVRMGGPEGWDGDCPGGAGCGPKAIAHSGRVDLDFPFSKLPEIPDLHPQKGRGPPQGLSASRGQAGDLGRAKAGRGWRFRGEGAEKYLCETEMLKAAAGRCSHPREATTLTVPVVSVLSPASSEASLPEEPTYNVFRPQPPRGEAAQLLKSRPESFWSLMKEPQKKVLSAHSKKSPQPLPTVYEAPMSLRPHPPKGRPGISRTERPWPH